MNIIRLALPRGGSPLRSIANLAAMLTLASVAHAGVVDFETLDTSTAPFAPLFADGDVVSQGEYLLNTQAVGSTGGLIGQLSDGLDQNSCIDAACPYGNDTRFMSILNDGMLHVGRADGGSISFGGASVAFLAQNGNPFTEKGLFFAVEADSYSPSGSVLGYAVYTVPVASTGSFISLTVDAGGLLSGGQYLTGSGNLTGATLNNSAITDLYFYAYYCSPTSSGCSAFSTNRAQFAIDDIALDVAAVPEPAQWATFMVGLVAVALTRCRQFSGRA